MRHIITRTHATDNTFYREHSLSRALFKEDTCYSNTIYREHNLQRTHATSDKHISVISQLKFTQENRVQGTHTSTNTDSRKPANDDPGPHHPLKSRSSSRRPRPPSPPAPPSPFPRGAHAKQLLRDVCRHNLSRQATVRMATA